MGSGGELLRQVTVAARAVAGSDDGEERVYAAATLRVLLEQRAPVSRALLADELSHTDACPRILTACANRDESVFDHFCDGLTRVRGADLVHVGVSRQVYDKDLVKQLRRWAERDVTAVPRLMIFDGPWAAQRTVTDGGVEIIGRLAEWLENDRATLPRLAAVRLIWRELLASPERAAVWGRSVWDLWPAPFAADRDLVFEHVAALHAGELPDLARPAPRGLLHQFVHAMTVLGVCAGPRPPARTLSLAELDDVAATTFPRMVAGQLGHTLGLMAARRAVLDADVDAIFDRYLAAPDPGTLAGGASFVETSVTGFLTGLTRDLDARAAVRPAVPPHLLEVRTRLIDLHAHVDATGIDAFGRIRGRLLATLVALDHPDLLVRRIERADTAHYHELKLGCEALARRLARADSEILVGVVDSVLGALRGGAFPWSYRVLEALVDELPERRWGHLQHRIAVARTAARDPGALLSPKVVQAILGDQDDQQLERIVVTGGQVLAPSLFAIRLAKRASVERGDVHLRELEHVPLAERIEVVEQWTGEALAGGAEVTAGELAQLLATVRRLHVAAYLSTDRAPASSIHDTALRAIAGVPTAWPHLLQPFPRGQYVGTTLLALIAEASLLAPIDVATMARTRAVCAPVLAATWAALGGGAVEIPDDEVEKLHRAIVASDLLGVALPRSGWSTRAERLDVDLAAVLVELESAAADDPSGFHAVNRRLLQRVESLRPPDSARVAYVVRLMMHNLKRRFDMHEPQTPAETLQLVRRMRALLGGPSQPLGDFRQVVADALELAGAADDQVSVELEDRHVALPEVVCLLLVEEMIANAVEHGAPGTKVVVRSADSGHLVVTNVPPPGRPLHEAVDLVLAARADSASGIRFAAEVADRWGLQLNIGERDGRVRVSLDVRGRRTS